VVPKKYLNQERDVSKKLYPNGSKKSEELV
jgi:hypothetical protein